MSCTSLLVGREWRDSTERKYRKIKDRGKSKTQTRCPLLLASLEQMYIEVFWLFELNKPKVKLTGVT